MICYENFSTVVSLTQKFCSWIVDPEILSVYKTEIKRNQKNGSEYSKATVKFINIL